MQDTGFPLTERDRLGLRGLLPPRVISFEQQYDRFSKFVADAFDIVVCVWFHFMFLIHFVRVSHWIVI